MFPSRDPSLSHHCTSVKFLRDGFDAVMFGGRGGLISSSLTSGVSPADQSGKPAGLPGHHQCGGSGRDLRHHRALRPVQVRHPHPEDWQQLQGLHVRCSVPLVPPAWGLVWKAMLFKVQSTSLKTRNYRVHCLRNFIFVGPASFILVKSC